MLLVFAAILSGFATYAALTSTPPFGDDPDTVIWLLTANLVILLTLAGLIARRMTLVWARRRQGMAGSRLHVRLVAIFSIMAAAPAIIMAVFSAFFFHFGVQSWFSERVRTAVMESQAVAESYLEEHQQVIKADLLAMANDLDREANLFFTNRAEFDRYMETQSFIRNLSEAMIFDESGKILAQSGLTFTLAFEEVPDFQMEQAKDGEVVITTGQKDDRVRAFVRLANFDNAYLFVGRMVDPTVLSHLESTQDATAEYNNLQGRVGNLQVLVTMIFIVVAVLLLLAATWVGISLAQQLVEPIGDLISASDRLRSGDMAVRVAEGRKIEEFDYLSKSFNRMTSQIQQQRDELMMANRQLDHRRRFTETILAGVSAGIVGVDEKGVISLANSSAAGLFGRKPDELSGRPLFTIIPQAEDLLLQAQAKPLKITQSEIPYTVDRDTRRTLLVRIAIEMMDGQYKGAVLTFDDITELQSAQRKAAWADVARRIAHEIKNPLTPIMLSAERLKRKYLKEIQTDPQVFSQCTDTIMRHVADIGRMVNEFSAFARMPEPVMQIADLNAEIRETAALQKEAHADITFRLRGLLETKDTAQTSCDVQQVRQALTNLIQNAIDSIHGRIKDSPQSPAGRIDVLLAHSDKGYVVALTDNGKGLPTQVDPDSLTEPYVTHREKGTGLGLAIVKKIMEDHKGQLVIGAPAWIQGLSGWEDLGGATIALVLPVKEDENTIRQVAA